MKYTLQEVISKAHKKQFLEVARKIYQNDPNWVCPLDIEIEAIFDPDKNSFFQHGTAKRWILIRVSDKEVVGRVAAFINQKKVHQNGLKVGGMGFFECINDLEAAYMLFDACQSWLREQGMDAMDGPINFGENDMWWGLLVDGFTQPAYGMNYHLPYYKDLFETYGFQVFYSQISKHLDITRPLPERWQKILQRVVNNPRFKFEPINLKNIQKYIQDFVTIYNDAWQFHENFTPVTVAQIQKTFEKLKPIIEPVMIWFAYVDNNPAGFIVCIPDINQIIKKFNGKFGWWQKLQFWYYLKIKRIMNRGRVTIIGVSTKYQQMGIEVGLSMLPFEPVLKRGYKEIELSWVGDFNPKMRSVMEATGAKQGKIHYTYRKLFDTTKPFERSKIIAMNTRK
ncbi:MAG: GNAT family N-acetyltransferase [Bacteroidia bacterium]|nr:GNAT family N-acetyltransferase [Bacteroidia bacterium]MDW8303104.1 GNAT family N-acetyltransferase [Bacteroidia bacterium]